MINLNEVKRSQKTVDNLMMELNSTQIKHCHYTWINYDLNLSARIIVAASFQGFTYAFNDKYNSIDKALNNLLELELLDCKNGVYWYYKLNETLEIDLN